MWTKLVGVAWEYHLTWLREEGHVTTASEASRLERYCQDHPRRIAKSDEAGCFPLHLAARNQRGEHSLTVVQALIAAFGHALQRKNNEGDLPLHLAARFQRGEYGLPLMSALMTAYPHGLQRRDIAGRLPLHCAAFQQQGRYAEALFTTLLIAYPEGLQEKTYDGNLPLHYAVLGHYSVVTIGKGRRALVMAVLKAFPEAAQKKNDSGNLPLHIAAANQTLPVVMALLKAYPEGVQQKSDSGALPLYYAAGNSEGTAVAVVRALLKAYPHAAQEKTNEGLLPLHMAAFYQRGEPHGIAVVTALLTAYPRGIMETNEKGQRPLTYSRGGRSDKALVDLMRKAEKGEWQPPAQEEESTAEDKEPTALESQTSFSQMNPEAITTSAAASGRSTPTGGTSAPLPPDATSPSHLPTMAYINPDSSPSLTSFPCFGAGDFSDISAEPIGSGTHKRVYSATFTGTTAASSLRAGDRVALLCFKDAIAPNLHEYKVMTLIRAPYLAKFYGVIQPVPSDPHLRLVSDLAPLGSLPDFFEQAEENGLDVSLSHKLVFAKQAGDGLSALHEHHLVHADVAARNVLVYAFDADNHHRIHVKLSDYGMVRERSKYTDVAAGVTHEAATTQPHPLSPKWASWESLNKDKFYIASDVWSFAVLTWEILTECNEPYPGVPHTVPAMIRHLTAGHTLVQPSDCNDVLWSILSRCWLHKRRDRPTLQDVLAQVALGLEHIAAAASAAASAAQLTATEAEVEAMKAAQQAWLKPDFGWRAGDINLCTNLDNQLMYAPRGNVACADPRAVDAGPLADRLSEAIEELVHQGGSHGGRFKANVDKITLCKNQSLITSFNERLARLHEQRLVNQGTSLFNGRWDDSDLSETDLADKQAVFERLKCLFVDTDLASGSGVRVALMWHGVSCGAVADAICSSGLSSRVTKEDEGYFGKGVYLTPESEYAAFYANQQQRPERGETYTLLLCAVCVANAYPVTRRGADYNDEGDANDGYHGAGETISKFHYNYGAQGTAKALYKGFDAHFVAINTKEEWQAATDVEDADYHELVVGNEDQVLPFAKVVVRIK